MVVRRGRSHAFFFTRVLVHRSLRLEAAWRVLYHAQPSLKSLFSMKTFVAKKDAIRRQWYIVDAADKVLGRVASEVARRLRGKHKAEYAPNVDTGDYVVVINASKIRVTGNKGRNKYYFRYSGYQSGLKRTSFTELQGKQPAKVVEHAVKGMLPKNPLGREMFRKLKVYSGAEHRHAAQTPKPLQI